MIASEKDRLECLRLAVSLVIPRHNVPAEQAAQIVIKTAKEFHKFISDERSEG